MTNEELHGKIFTILDHISGSNPVTAEWLKTQVEQIITLVREHDRPYTAIHIDESLDKLYPQGWDRQGPSETLTQYFTTHTKEQ